MMTGRKERCRQRDSQRDIENPKSENDQYLPSGTNSVQDQCPAVKRTTRLKEPAGNSSGVGFPAKLTGEEHHGVLRLGNDYQLDA